MTEAELNDDYEQSDSALFWFVIATAVFAATGFVAGVLYPIFM